MKKFSLSLLLAALTAFVFAAKVNVNVFIPSDTAFPIDTVIMFQWTDPDNTVLSADTLKRENATSHWWKATPNITKSQYLYSVYTDKGGKVFHYADGEAVKESTNTNLYIEVGAYTHSVSYFGETHYMYAIGDTDSGNKDHNYTISSATATGGVKGANFVITPTKDTAPLYHIALYLEKDQLFDEFDVNTLNYNYTCPKDTGVTIVKFTIWPMSNTRVKHAAMFTSNTPFIISPTTEQPQVGDQFTAVTGVNTLTYQVTEAAPKLWVKVVQSGHKIIENSDLLIPDTVIYLGNKMAVKSVDNWPQFQTAKTIAFGKNIDFPFVACDVDSLVAFVLDPDDERYSVVNGVVYSKDKKTIVRCPGNKAYTTADFPAGITEIGWRAFLGCSKLDELSIPNTVTDIEGYAFNQSAIRAIHFPASVTYLTQGVLRNCANLTNVDFASSATVDIGGWDAFTYSKILQDQPMGVKVIDSIAIIYNGTESKVVIPDSVVDIAYAFMSTNQANAAALDTIVLPAQLKAVPHEFLACSKTNPFPNLKTVVCRATAPAIVWTSSDQDSLDIFSDQPLELIVPCGSKTAYQAATKWSKTFPTITEGAVYELKVVQTAGGMVTSENTENCGEIKLTATPDSNYKFIQWSDGTNNNPYTLLLDKDTEISALFEVATDFDTVTDTPAPLNGKFLRDGQLLILHNGVLYNANGARVR